MKLLISIFLLFILFTGCRKYNGCSDSDDLAILKGKWELRSRMGGMAPGGNYQPGNGNLINFSDSTYEKWYNGQITVKGTYTISQGNNPETGTMMKKINYEGGFEEYFEFVNNQLVLYSGIIAADGTISKYARL